MDCSLDDAARRAISALELSDVSKRSYRYAIRAFLAFTGPDATITDITNQTLYEYRLWLRDVRGYGRRTVQNYISAAGRVLNWLDLREELPDGVSYNRIRTVCSGTAGNRRQPYQRRKTDPDIHHLLEYYTGLPLPESGPGRLMLLRDRALLQTLYDTATRVSEALALTRADVQDGRAIRVRLTQTKGDKPRTVFLKQARPLLAEYCREREDDRRAPLFVSHGRNSGTALTSQHVRRIVKVAAEALGLDPGTSPHILRHACAQDMLDSGMPIEWVAAYLGHKRIDTTRTVYAWETDEGNLLRMVQKHRGKKRPPRRLPEL